MRKHLQCEADGKVANIAWLSFQPDGSVSFGLHDNTFISPQFKGRRGVWSAFNRRETQYLIQSSPAALEQVRNPHFTYHPPGTFRLKTKYAVTLFEGIALVSLVLRQDGELCWIRAISKPIHELLAKPHNSTRADGIDSENWRLSVPHVFGSIMIAVDLFPLGTRYARPPIKNGLVREIEWHNVSVRMMAQLGPPQIGTLSWFHSA